MIVNAHSIIEAADLVELVKDKVALKRSGSNWMGCCPFHNERTPSFVVNAVKQFYKCFGCGKAGGVVNFVMELEGLRYPEALEYIARACSIVVEYDKNIDKAEIEKRKGEHEANMDVLAKLQAHYVEHAAIAKEYSSVKRMVSEVVMDQFGIGYATDTWDSAMAVLNTDDDIRAAERLGVIKKKGSSVGFYQKLRHRITIPIYDGAGLLLGHAGEYMPGSELEGDGDKPPKYINPPEYAGWWEKSRVLFGLNNAYKGIRAAGYAILVEGYWACIAMHDADMTMTVASMGTALTKEQVKLLKRYTNTVYVMRDGDEAGYKSTVSAVDMLASDGLNVYVVPVPVGCDPQDMIYNWRVMEQVRRVVKLPNVGRSASMDAYVCENKIDGVEWVIQKWMDGATDVSTRADAMEYVVELLGSIKREIKRSEYIDYCVRTWKMKASELKRNIADVQKAKAMEHAKHLAADDGSLLPKWANSSDLFEYGFVQNDEPSKEYSVGIYFNDKSLTRVTNFTIKPLYHIYEMSNNRRLIQVNNGVNEAVVEMPSRALISRDVFELALIEKGAYYTDYTFTTIHFKRIAATLANKMPKAWELRTLGWQPEGFFTFANKAVHNDMLLDYDDLGMIEVDGRHYLSSGVSAIHKDERIENNPFENDLYLKYVESKMDWKQWSALFYKVYGDHGKMGIAFVFITVYLDIVLKTTKRPLLYCYGAKGSGKSDFAESICWLFFSGKNAEGKLKQGYNLNPGQGTPFSFFNNLERFRNCPSLMNEFDENTIEDFKHGALKASYDGEGREVGDGDTGKKRKTKIQKVQGTLIVVGQYLSIKDDGSVLSRSLCEKFNLERLSKLTADDNKSWKELKDAEQAGLSSIVCELLLHRGWMQQRYDKQFWLNTVELQAELKQSGVNAEVRILRNYVCAYTAVQVMAEKVQMPFDIAEFKAYCIKHIRDHNGLLRDNNALSQFWKIVEFLFDQKQVVNNRDIMIEATHSVRVVRNSVPDTITFTRVLPVLYVRMNSVYSLYAKAYKEKTGKPATNEETLLTYMKDQNYYIGLCPAVSFSDKRTSAYMLNYEKLGIDLMNDEKRNEIAKHVPEIESVVDADMPF